MEDETTPLLRRSSQVYVNPANESSIPARDLVRYDPNGDSECPREWPQAYKWFIVFLLAFMAFTVQVPSLSGTYQEILINSRTFTCISIVPVANRIIRELSHGEGSKSSSVLLVTIWELGEAAGPLLIAPMSEVYGRYPVMNAANCLFIIATVLAALSSSVPLLIAARAMTGLAVASNVLNPAIVGDIFISAERGGAMSLIMLAPLTGGAVGPAVAGFVSERFGWRYVLWISAGLASICEIMFLTCFQESYEVTILKKRAARLREETGIKSLRTIYDDKYADAKPWRKMGDAILRPFLVLFDSAVLQALAFFGSVCFSYFYIMSVTLSDILEDIYHISPQLIGISFISFSLGSAVSVVICKYLLDGIYIRLRDRNKNDGKPEYRLPLVIVGGFTLPLTICLYGWIAETAAPMPLILLATALLGMTLLLTYVPLTTYVVDASGRYAASAMTGFIVTRCLMGTFLPLLVEPLVERYGWGIGMTLIAAVSLCLAPIPVFMYVHGKKWRQASRYTRDEKSQPVLPNTR